MHFKIYLKKYKYPDTAETEKVPVSSVFNPFIWASVTQIPVN